MVDNVNTQRPITITHFKPAANDPTTYRPSWCFEHSKQESRGGHHHQQRWRVDSTMGLVAGDNSVPAPTIMNVHEDLLDGAAPPNQRPLGATFCLGLC